MIVIHARGVNDALVKAIEYINEDGVSRNSRNGEVLQAPFPVATVYDSPVERVLFWPWRDANPFFHLYESLWMLSGRRDIAPLVRYVSTAGKYSDDGVTQHDAYGFRWRCWFGLDQLDRIAELLRRDHDDRRCVLQMWDPTSDLGRVGKAVPCNLTATFQVSTAGELDLVVFCRSNDIVWGCYGANAVHFSMLLEYMAQLTGIPMGRYTQVSVNWHAYTATLEPMLARMARENFVMGQRVGYGGKHGVMWLAMSADSDCIARILSQADRGVWESQEANQKCRPWERMVSTVLRTHHLYKTVRRPLNFAVALSNLGQVDPHLDWVIAAREWIERRQLAWTQRNDDVKEER